jgi:hypothetical protein
LLVIVNTLWNVIVIVAIASCIVISFKESITEAQTLSTLNILDITLRETVSY